MPRVVRINVDHLVGVFGDPAGFRSRSAGSRREGRRHDEKTHIFECSAEPRVDRLLNVEPGVHPVRRRRISSGLFVAGLVVLFSRSSPQSPVKSRHTEWMWLAFVLRIVVLDQERRRLNPIVVRIAPVRAPPAHAKKMFFPAFFTCSSRRLRDLFRHVLRVHFEQRCSFSLCSRSSSTAKCPRPAP